MASFYSSWVNDLRIRLDINGSGTKRTLAVYAEMRQGFDWNGTLQLSGSWSGNKGVYVYAPWGGGTRQLYARDITYTSSGTYVYHAVLPIVWPGGTVALTGSTKVTVGTKPGAPSGVSFAFTGDTTGTLSWTKGSGASTTQITASKNGAAWYDLANPSGSSQAITGLALDSSWRFNLYSKNAAGKSSVVGPYGPYYTKPKTPGKPKLSGDPGGTRLTWTDNSYYQSGIHIQRESPPGEWEIRKTGIKTWVDSDPVQPETRYQVRGFAGELTNPRRAYSDWSAWSEPVFDLVWRAPKITRLTAERCDGAGNLVATGTYLRVVSSGETTPVPIDGVETNKMTRQYRVRKVRDSWPATWVTMVTGVDAGPWSNVAVIAGSGDIDVTEPWEVQLRVTDTYTSGDGTVRQTTVPVARVALALSKTGIGAGKIWERGALDVGGDLYVEGDTFLVVGGEVYPKTVSLACPSTPEFTKYGDTYARTISFTAPYVPPAGYHFVPVSQISSGYTVMSAVNRSLESGQIRVRHIQVGNNSTAATSSVTFELVKYN